jgi:hypothetical protein
MAQQEKNPAAGFQKLLWQAAVESCKSNSVLQVSKALRLNFNELKDRVESGRGNGDRCTEEPRFSFY